MNYMARLLVKNTPPRRNGNVIKIRVNVGYTVGYLTVVGEPFWNHVPGRRVRTQCVVCECSKCQGYIVAPVVNVLGGRYSSCGCWKGKRRYEMHKGIFASKEPLYKVWLGMKARCHRPKNEYYRMYGRKGIFVCDLWRNSYPAFRRWSLENGYEVGLSIDRIDSSKGYCPENCQFITRRENSQKSWTDMARRFTEKDREIAKLKATNEMILIAYACLIRGIFG